MTRLQDLKPFDPVFDVEKMMGGLNIGNTPPYVAPCSGVLSIIGDIALSSPAINGVQSLVKDGNYVYITGGTYDGITIVDVSDPTTPVQVGSVSSADLNAAYGIVKVGDYCYVSADISSNGRLTAVDVTNPAAPSVGSGVSNFRIDNPRNIFRVGNLVYVTGMIGTGGMGIFDISTPGSPTYVTGHATSTMNFSDSFAVDGIYCFTARPDSDAFTVIDVSGAPTFVTEIVDVAQLNLCQALRQLNDVCYVVCPGDDLLTSIDVSTPTTPAILDSLIVGDNPQAFALDGVTAYVACKTADAIDIVSISNPAAMSVIGSFTDVALNDIRNIIVDGNYLYAICDTSPANFVVIDRCT